MLWMNKLQQLPQDPLPFFKTWFSRGINLFVPFHLRSHFLIQKKKKHQSCLSFSETLDGRIPLKGVSSFQIHGVLNAISWGILMPLGAIIARYLRTFKSADPAWFYLHASCQFSAYVIGVAGWATGLQLGQKSKGVMYASHRNIGIALFCLASLQAFALFLRPKKDHKYRIYWNVYHHLVGYAVIVLSIINVFKGLDILDPHKKWRTAYITVISILGGIAVVLEVITWAIVLRRRSGQST